MRKLEYFTLITAIACCLFGCNMKENAQLVFINAKIYTVDSAFSMKQAMAVSNGIILATGTNEEILEAWEPDSLVDLGGKPVYPGFNDGHCHFYGYALGLYQSVDLKGTASFDEILQLLRNYHEKHSYVWILGRGWDQNDWTVKEFPDNSMLDNLFPDNPVILTRVDGHAVLANSEALRRAGISAETRIKGGEVRLKNGKPTGILLDNAADLINSMIPDPDAGMKSDALLKAQEDCFGAGLTSVTDAGLNHATVMLIDSLQVTGQLKMRINVMLSPTQTNLDQFVEKGPFQKDRLTVNSIKLYADGALGSRGALLLEPYSDDPGNYGLLMSPKDYYREILLKAFEKDFQVNTHCIGDSANRLMLKLYAEVLKGKNDRRWRIEHAQVIHPDDFRLFGDYSIIPSVQSTHCTSDMYWAGERLGPEREKGAYAYKKLLEQNGWLVNGTDFPVESINPLYTFYAAVARKDMKGYPEGGFHPENALNREEALKSITLWPAKGSFEETRKGSLEAGKFADFVILEEDIMEIEISKVPEVRVLETYLDGEKVY
jgi:predicted amidohydrolase YtcJ